MSRDPGIVVRIEAPAEERERLIAELYALETLGLEERDTGLIVYFPSRAPADPVWRALEALEDVSRGIRVGTPTPVPPTDWEREWRKGLKPRRVAGLWIRPSWCASRGQPELCIDPEQAFGSGEHATTRIALELLLPLLRPGDRILDVGTGSGVLGLGALRQGAAAAVALDIDRAACGNARENARRNALAPVLYCGTLGALRARQRFDVVAANLLWAELEPWVDRAMAHADRHVVIAGPLARERDAVRARVEREGRFRLEREQVEEQSGDAWWGATFRAGPDPV